jgi:outer membrane protein TolC
VTAARVPRSARLTAAALLVAALSPSSSGAQDTPPPAGAATEAPEWSLAALVERALAQAPLLRAAAAAEAAAGAELAEATASRLPAASATASAFRYQEPMVVTPIHGFAPGQIPAFDETLIQGALQLRYDLWDPTRAPRILQRERQRAAAGLALAAERGQVAAHTVATFLRARAMAATLTAHREREQALAAERERVERLLAVGKVAAVDLRRVEAAVAAAAADRVGVAAALDVAVRELARLTALPLDDVAPERLAPTRLASPGGDRDEQLAAILAASPQAELARQELAAAEAVVRTARAARLPVVRAEASYLGFAGGNLDGTAEWNAGLRLALPLRDRTLAARIARAEAGRAAAAARLAAVEDRVAGELDRALAALAAAEARAEAFAASRQAAGEVVRVERLRLDAGAGDEADYLRAEAELLFAGAAQIEAAQAADEARAELARLAGRLNPAWLAGQEGR